LSEVTGQTWRLIRAIHFKTKNPVTSFEKRDMPQFLEIGYVN
jgi:hypothetical protein